MNRRALLASLAAGYVLGPRFALARSASTGYRLGTLWAGPCENWKSETALFLKLLGEFGYVEGRNLAIEERCFEMDYSRAAPMAAELVRLKSDVLLTTGTPQTKALQEATKTIPIVTSVADPVASGFTKSISRPGGNITGLCHEHPEHAAKQIELLRRVMPRLDRLVLIGDLRNPSMREFMRPDERAAKAAGLRVEVRMVERSGYEAVFSEMKRLGMRAAIINSPDVDIPAVPRLAIRYGVATVLNGAPGYIEVGGLMSYDAIHENPRRRTVVTIDKLFRGVKPADIPWELPDRTHLAINLRTAKALGLLFPQDILLRADKVIE